MRQQKEGTRDEAGDPVQKAVEDNDTQVQSARAEMGNHRSEELDRTWEAEMRRGTKEKKKKKRKERQDI